MVKVSDLLKDDIIYGFCINTQTLEIYQVDHVTLTEVHFHTIIGAESFYMEFPKELDLEKPVLCKYEETCWWVYTINFDSLKHLMEVDWNGLYWLEQYIFYFDKYLDIWTQTIHKLK